MKTRRWAIILCSLLAVVIGFFGVKRWLTNEMPELFGIERISITIQPDSIFLKISARIPHGDVADLLIDSMRYSVAFDTVEFASGMKKFGNEAADTLIDLPLGMDRKKLFSTIKKLQVKDSTSLNVKLEPYLRAPGRNKKIPFAINKQIKVPVPPEITIADMDLEKLKLDEISLSATLQVINLNPIQFIIHDGSLNLDFPGLFDGVIAIVEPVHLKEMDTTFIDAAIQLGEMKLARTAWNFAFKKDEVEYSINGKLYVSPVDEPKDTIDVIIKSSNNNLLKTGV